MTATPPLGLARRRGPCAAGASRTCSGAAGQLHAAAAARRRRCSGSASSISARCSRCCCRASSRIDDFTGLVVREFTLATYGELLQRAEPRRSSCAPSSMAAAVTVAAAVIAFPIAYYAARYAAAPWKALFYLGVMLPLWSSYLVKVYAWKLMLAKEGVISWVCGRAAPRLAARRGCSACR